MMVVVDDDEDRKMMVMKKMKTVAAMSSAYHGLATIFTRSFLHSLPCLTLRNSYQFDLPILQT